MGEGDAILALKPGDVQGPNPIPPAVSADDVRWLTLCVYFEARGEPQDGKAAVARVILYRAQRKPPFFSDGTIKGTVLWPSQFSWTCFDYVDGHYTRVAHTSEEVEARVAKLCAQAQANRLVWDACQDVAVDVLEGTYAGGADYQKLGPDALLYDNLAVSQPAWAVPGKLICQIGHHAFFRP